MRDTETAALAATEYGLAYCTDETLVAVRKAGREAHRELKARRHNRWLLKERAAGGSVAMSNFMAGVTWALSCRAALRTWAGHSPPGGKRPQHGAPWLPWEMLACVRSQVKERGWHPIAAKTWADARGHLQAEMSRRDLPDWVEHQTVQFVIPMTNMPRQYGMVRWYDDGEGPGLNCTDFEEVNCGRMK